MLHSSHSLGLGVHKSTPVAMTQIVLHKKVEERKQQCVDGWKQNELLNTIYRNSFFFFSFLRVSSPFDSLDWGLTLMRGTSYYSDEGLVAMTI